MTIQETTFGPKTYVALKKSITFDQVSDKTMYEQAGIKLGAYIEANDLKITGPWTVMYFTWDTETQTSDMAIAFPVDGIDTVNDMELSIITIPETKACMSTLEGPYDDKIGPVHGSLMEYATRHGYTQNSLPVIALEEYRVGSMQDQNPENWRTNVYSFYN